MTQLSTAQTISEFLACWLAPGRLPAPEEKILFSYYSSYVKCFPPRIRYFYDRQTLEVSELIQGHSGCRLLEIGCGCGTESLWLARQGADVTSIDLNIERLGVARKRKEILGKELGRELHVAFVCQSVLELADSNTYDIIWLEQAFHHLEPRLAVIRKLADLLKPGGYLVISEANGLNVLLQAQLFRKRGRATIKHFTDHQGNTHVYGNERILSGASLRRLLAKNGFQCQKLTHFRLFPNHREFCRMARMERHFPQWGVPFFTHFNYIGKKI